MRVNKCFVEAQSETAIDNNGVVTCKTYLLLTKKGKVIPMV